MLSSILIATSPTTQAILPCSSGTLNVSIITHNRHFRRRHHRPLKSRWELGSDLVLNPSPVHFTPTIVCVCEGVDGGGGAESWKQTWPLLSSLLHIAFLLKIFIFTEGSCRLSTYTHKIFSDVIKPIFLTLPLGTFHKLAGTSFCGLLSPVSPSFSAPRPRGYSWVPGILATHRLRPDSQPSGLQTAPRPQAQQQGQPSWEGFPESSQRKCLGFGLSQGQIYTQYLPLARCVPVDS